MTAEQGDPLEARRAAPTGASLDDASAQIAQRALMTRPELSIRTRIAIVFVLLFVLCSAITVAAVASVSTFESKIRFLETAGSFSTEVEEARRNEKNYFLYGTNLAEALESAGVAGSHLERSADPMRAVLGDARYDTMRGSFQRYHALLEQLVGLEDAGGGGPEKREIEVRLRTEGAQLLDDANEMIDRERLAVNSLLHTAKMAAIAFLIFMLLVMVLFGGFVSRAVLRPLNRFVDYVARIGAGNYEPIRPARRYRDEFSHLALAFNKMLGEVATRQEQLVQSGKMAAVGTLTSGIAHELNNPLNNIGLTVEALIDDPDAYSADERRHMLEQAYTQVERASSTVRNLLDFTRKDRSAFTRLAVPDVVQSATRLVANEAVLAGVHWDVRIADDTPPIRGNPHELQQVFLNLFLNAIQAMPDGGTVRVTGSAEGEDAVRIDVSDEGAGIAAEHLDEIFDPFFTTGKPGEGTGLGLSVSLGIIEKHGGSISVESEVGHGSTFTLRLPRAPNGDTQ